LLAKMLERRYQQPSAFEIGEKENLIESVGMSVLLLKPEISLLELDEQTRLTQLIEAHFALYGEPVFVFPVFIDRETAEKLWQRDVEQYPWAESYYEHMTSSTSVAVILVGQESASSLKRKIRTEMADSIARIKKVLCSDFNSDIVHGSDPNDGLLELQTFIEVVQKDTRSN